MLEMKNNRKILYLAGFLFSIPVALVAYINSSFLEIHVGKNYVGLLYIVSAFITILCLLKMPRVLTRLGNRATIILFSLLISFSFFLLALVHNSVVVIFAFILYIISINFVLSSLDIFLEDFSKNSSIGKLRGFYLMIINLAWVVAQVISGSIISKSSFYNIYLYSGGFIILVAFIFILFLQNFKDPEYKKVAVLKTIKYFIKNKHISKVYISNLVLQFFYAWMVIYTPIYLHEYMGFAWDKIGIIFSIMLLPFVLLDFPLGKLSDKIGEKKMLIFGFSIITISVLIIPTIKEPIFWMWALILFATRIGAATIEVMNESYFFKNITEENASGVTFFRNAPSVAYVIAPLIAIPVLFFTPSFQYLFFILGVVLLLGLLTILKLKDVK